MVDFCVHRDAFGRLVCTLADGTAHEGVEPVRSFPVSEPGWGIALVAASGAELVWIPALAALPESLRLLLEEELAQREFVPVIRRILSVSGIATPCEWAVETDRGTTQFMLRGEEDIRRLTPHTLLIVDTHGIRFLIRDVKALDKGSRRLLERFL